MRTIVVNWWRHFVAQFILVFFLTLACCVVITSSSYAASSEMVTIGVLAKRGVDKTRLRWAPTADYLSQQLPHYQFEIRPLGFDEINDAVANESVDFILVNSGIYVELERRFAASRIVTMKNRIDQHHDSPIFGGVIFMPNDSEIVSLNDLKGRRFSAVAPTSLGGFQMAWREMKQVGIDPYRDLAALQFAGTHDAVVFSVLNREVDAGTVRTDTLERMASEGLIHLDDIRTIAHATDDHFDGDFDYLHSTALYPEWPLAKLKHTPIVLAESVARMLMDMPADSQAAIASNTAGWTIPLSYQPVHDLLKALALPPYEPINISKLAFIKQNQLTVLLLLLTFLLVLGLVWGLYRKNYTLTQTTVALRKASEAKSEFLSSMNHELRTPLNAILGFAQLLESDPASPLTDTQKQSVDYIITSGEHLLKLIGDVLDLAAIESQQLTLVTEVVSLSDVVSDTLKLLNVAAEKNQVTLVVEPNESLSVTADSTKLKQILINLINNSIKYNKAGGTVTINWRLTDSGRVRVAITDTGIGIAEKHQDKLFKAFNRLGHENSTIEGTGVGLSVTKGLVERMDGVIGFDSEHHQGTTFWFELPLAQAHRHIDS